MKTIKIDIEDDSVEKFFEELIAFCKKENISEDEIKIEGLTIQQYIKHYVIDSE